MVMDAREKLFPGVWDVRGQNDNFWTMINQKKSGFFAENEKV